MRLFGIHPVAERLSANPRSITKVFLDRTRSDSLIYKLCREHDVPVEAISTVQFERMAVGVHAQGVLAEIDGYAYVDFDSLLVDEAPRPTLMFLDGLSDPHNLGSILRTLACLGGFAVVIPRRDSVDVTDTVLRVASGGENFVPVSRVGNLAQAVEVAKKHKYWIATTVVSGGKPIWSEPLPEPLGVILGAEGDGVRPGLLKHADFRITLPMSGAELSFNVAIATALTAYEVNRQRHAK